jgi:hypothetical protein
MSTGAMRRAQLVTPFGVGAMSVLVNGTSVITAGLDHWYEVVDQSALAMEEYQEHDWRLESRLKVSEFRLPRTTGRRLRAATSGMFDSLFLFFASRGGRSVSTASVWNSASSR